VELAAYGEENCRHRAKRFDIIASLRLRLGSSLIHLILKRFERSEAIERLERLEPFGLVVVQCLMLNSNPRVGEIKLEEIVDRSIVRKLDDSGLIDRTLAAAGVR
jgi:hypothetical protein